MDLKSQKMSSLILYLLESSAVLAILFILYLVLLRKETFFNLNRFFLLAILGFSFLIPLLSFDLSPFEEGLISKPVEELSDMRLSYYDVFDDWSFEGRGTSPDDVIVNNNASKEESNKTSIALVLVLAIYVIGLIALLFRLIWTYHWIHKLGRLNAKEVIQGVTVVKVPHQIAPFSFMSSVFVSEELIGTDEFQQILAHEKIHIKEKHSIDLLIVQLLAAVLWFNPVVWWLIKSLKTTHEYIADKKMITQGYSLVEYQSLLLRQLISNNSFGLVHNFNLSFIKKRITMMKIKESGWAGRAKVALVLFAVVLFSLVIVQCNAVIDEPISINKEVNQIKNDTHSGLSEIDTPYTLSLVSDAPVFPGCENLGSEFNIRKCFSESISNHFRENFDVEVLTNNPTKRKRVLMFLMINQEGEVSLTRSPSTNIYLESEIRRVIKEFPKLIPGIRHGLSVSVRHGVSIGIVDNKIDVKSSSGLY